MKETERRLEPESQSGLSRRFQCIGRIMPVKCPRTETLTGSVFDLIPDQSTGIIIHAMYSRGTLVLFQCNSLDIGYSDNKLRFRDFDQEFFDGIGHKKREGFKSLAVALNYGKEGV